MDLYQEMGGQVNQQTQPQNNNFLNNLSSFASNFKGDPKQQVMNLLQQRGINMNSPEVNSAIQQTNQIYNMLRRGK